MRTTRSILAALVALSAVACSKDSLTGATQSRVALDAGVPVYTQDFSAPVGAEWSNALETASPTGEKFLGEFSNETTTLSLSGLADHDSVTVMVDVYFLRSWDGVDADWGTDAFSIKADGAFLLNSTFANTDYLQNYPASAGGATTVGRTGALAVNSLGYTYWEGVPIDATYRFSFKFGHSSSTLTLDFAALGLQGIEDESWGIDNVVVSIGN